MLPPQKNSINDKNKSNVSFGMDFPTQTYVDLAMKIEEGYPKTVKDIVGLIKKLKISTDNYIATLKVSRTKVGVECINTKGNSCEKLSDEANESYWKLVSLTFKFSEPPSKLEVISKKELTNLKGELSALYSQTS